MKMGDQIKAIDGSDTICLQISSESLHHTHLKQNREQIQLHIHGNDEQNVRFDVVNIFLDIVKIQ